MDCGLSNVIEVFLELVQIDSPSGNEQPVREWLKNKFSELGCIHEIDSYGNLRLFRPGELAGEPRLFSSHMDTVEPGRGIRPVIHEDQSIASDGTTVLGADDKDGITALYCALERLTKKHVPLEPLEFLFTVQEEDNIRGAAQIQPGWLQSRIGWVFDGPGSIGNLYRNGVGKIGLKLEVKGRAAHSGICPEKGHNALLAAAKSILSFPPGRMGNATVNYGVISGGRAENIVPEQADIYCEIRADNASLCTDLAERLENSWRRTVEKDHCRLIVTMTAGYPPFRLNDSVLLRRTSEIFEDLGIKCEVQTFHAGCDANCLCATHKLDMCIIATGRKDNHTTDEKTNIAALERLTLLAEKLMTCRSPAA